MKITHSLHHISSVPLRMLGYTGRNLGNFDLCDLVQNNFTYSREKGKSQGNTSTSTTSTTSTTKTSDKKSSSNTDLTPKVVGVKWKSEFGDDAKPQRV